jgi:hypothetical protein
MPDISMCLITSCRSRHSCYRCVATPSETTQAYSNFKPGPRGEKCRYYIKYETPNKETKVRR